MEKIKYSTSYRAWPVVGFLAITLFVFRKAIFSNLVAISDSGDAYYCFYSWGHYFARGARGVDRPCGERRASVRRGGGRARAERPAGRRRETPKREARPESSPALSRRASTSRA